MKTFKDLFISSVWGIISFLFVFFLVPTVFIATPDILWISLCIAVPVIISLFIFRKWNIRPVFVVVGLLVQFALLILLRNPVSHSWGISMQGLGAFEYISLFAFPLGETAISFILQKLLIKKGEHTNV